MNKFFTEQGTVDGGEQGHPGAVPAGELSAESVLHLIGYAVVAVRVMQ